MQIEGHTHKHTHAEGQQVDTETHTHTHTHTHINTCTKTPAKESAPPTHSGTGCSAKEGALMIHRGWVSAA